jgi:hypothetical protein
LREAGFHDLPYLSARRTNVAFNPPQVTTGSFSRYARSEFRRYLSAESFKDRTFIGAPRVDDSALKNLVKG